MIMGLNNLYILNIKVCLLCYFRKFIESSWGGLLFLVKFSKWYVKD